MKFTAVVLAGSRPGRDAFAEAHGAQFKALIPVAGEPMVRRPVRALLASRSIGEVIVLSQAADQLKGALPADKRLQIRKSQGTIAATILALCEDKRVRWPLLVTTADHALLDAAMVDEFCTRAGDADVAIGVVERVLVLRRFPDTRRTWLRFRSGSYTGTNLFALKSPSVAKAVELWRSVEQDRKKAWRLLWMLGPTTFAGAALRMRTLDETLARIGRKLRLEVRAVELANPLAAVDVDKPADHALVEAILEGRA